MVVINLYNQSRENLKLDLVSEVSLFSMVKETHTLQFVLNYRSGTVNSKSFVGKVLLPIKRKFELTYAL